MMDSHSVCYLQSMCVAACICVGGVHDLLFTLVAATAVLCGGLNTRGSTYEAWRCWDALL